MKNDNLKIGYIKCCHNWEGNLRIIPVSDYYQRFFDLKYVLIPIFGALRKFYVEEISFTDGDIYIKFLNFESLEDVKFLIGKEMFVSPADSISLEDDTYFIHDVVGCFVFKEKFKIGKVIDVISLPANDVYVIKSEQDKEILIPAIKDVVKKVDVEKKKILIDEDFELFDD